VVKGSRGGSDHQRILEPGPRNAEQTLTQLIAVLDYQDLARAIERLEKGSGVSSNENGGQLALDQGAGSAAGDVSGNSLISRTRTLSLGRYR
jgi:hypothetical protein